MKSKSVICHYMHGTGCDNCGDINKNRGGKPCNELIPDYIPDNQISKFIKVRRKYV